MAEVAHGANDTSITSTTFWTTSPYAQIESVVDALFAAGYRLVSEDDDTGCSCSASTRIVLHDDGTYCGDTQRWLITGAVLEHHPNQERTSEDTAGAILAALRGGAE